MNRFKPAAHAYVRPTQGWWRRNPYFMRYMIREGTAVFLSLYALILLAGLNALCHGEAAFNAWRNAMASAPALAFHAAAFMFVVYHSITWFQVMPKTAPQLKIAPALMTRAGYAATAFVSLLIWVAVWR